MIWRVEKGGRRSFLVGTAHFFPYSFKNSLSHLLRDSRTVLFEGPLDQHSMEMVRNAGFQEESDDDLIHELDEATVASITKAIAAPIPAGTSSLGLRLLISISSTSLHTLVKGMKPWMAFFTIYSRFLEKNGWKYSVDMEAYGIARKMGKKVVFLETIDEQIQVLESLSREQIINFLKRIDHWKSYTRDFVQWYLDADLEKISRNPYGFPTRSPWVIEHRDNVFCERMVQYLKEGNAAAFVGSPHVAGISRMLSDDGYEVSLASH